MEREIIVNKEYGNYEVNHEWSEYQGYVYVVYCRGVEEVTFNNLDEAIEYVNKRLNT